VAADGLVPQVLVALRERQVDHLRQRHVRGERAAQDHVVAAEVAEQSQNRRQLVGAAWRSKEIREERTSSPRQRRLFASAGLFFSDATHRSTSSSGWSSNSAEHRATRRLFTITTPTTTCTSLRERSSLVRISTNGRRLMISWRTHAHRSRRYHPSREVRH